MTRVAILDYGMGNLRSVEKALEKVGAEAEITADRERLSQRIMILPGVGAFPKAMGRVKIGLDGWSTAGSRPVPVLGTALRTLLFDSSWRQSQRARASARGPLERTATRSRIWWSVRWEHSSRPPSASGDPSLRPPLRHAPPQDDVLGTAAYGERFACAVERPPLYGVQFHPEKSSSAGLGLLANFIRICS